MKRSTLNLQQGSQPWLVARAESDGTASEAPAMAGKSKYQTRDELLLQRKTGLAKNIDSATQAIFNKGHEAEASARKIAEEIIGEELSPVTCVVEVDGLRLLASLDGVDFETTVIWEHKLWNEQLAQQVQDGNLDAHYTIQLDQELLASGAEKCLFMVSDGTKGKCVWMWYETTDAKATALVNGWKQFKKDLDTFVPPKTIEKVEAETVESLPVPSVVVSGSITKSNLAEITPLFDNYLSNINTTLSTDQDFADAEANAKNCRETAKRIKALRENIIAQMADVNAVDSALNNYEEAFNKVGLQLEKAVKEQKETLKANAILKAQEKYYDFVNSLEKTLPFGIQVHLTKPNFSEAIKGIKTIQSMHSRLNDAVAKGMVDASTLANNVSVRLAYIDAASKGYEHLIVKHDLAFKDIEFIKLQIQSIKDAEDKRKAEYEASIKAQAEATARAKVEAEQREKEAQINEAKPEVSKSETNPSLSQYQVAENQSSLTQLPASLEAEFSKQFPPTRTKPSANEMVEIIANHCHVDKATAHKWLCDTDFFALLKAA
jgi:predicted phage-related endonuclease